MSPPKFRFRHTDSADRRERVPDAVALHRDLVESDIVEEFVRLHPDSDLVQRLRKVPDESGARTDAVAAVVEDDGDSLDGWQVRWVLGQQPDGALVVRSMHLQPKWTQTPAGGVTARLLRDLKPSTAVARLSGEPDDAEHVSEFSDLLIKWARQQVSNREFSAAPKKGPGRPRLSDDLLAEVAVAYLKELPHGPGIYTRMSERREINRPVDTVKDWVRNARKRGFLTPATKTGQKGAGPGDALIDYIHERTNSDG